MNMNPVRTMHFIEYQVQARFLTDVQTVTDGLLDDGVPGMSVWFAATRLRLALMQGVEDTYSAPTPLEGV